MKKSLPVVTLCLLLSLLWLTRRAPPPAAAAPANPAACALLDDPVARRTMSGAFETALTWQCGRALVRAVNQPMAFAAQPGGDVPVSNPSGDYGASHTQSETTIAINPETGTICAAYNDSFHFFAEGNGFSGYSVSVDGGATFTDRGAIGNGSRGDPSLAWRRLDGKFYFASLMNTGLGIFRSDDDCQTFTLVSNFSLTNDDKELITIDNNPDSPYYGRIYVTWKDFSNGSRLHLMYSDNGGLSWSTRVPLGDTFNVQGPWPAVGPDGAVYVAWLHWPSYPNSIAIKVARSTDGGDSVVAVTPPLVSAVNPRAAGPTAACARTALNGNIRLYPLPQIAVGGNGVLHVVYAYDPDGYNTGDVIDVFYRRSLDGGETWEPEIRLNDDDSDNDNFMPTLSVSADGGTVVAAWYDRRLDPDNLLFDFYMTTSYNGGATWGPNVRVSDESSPVYIDPNMAACYHGDYDQQAQYNFQAHLVWADDRNMQNGHNDPDVWFDRALLAPPFARYMPVVARD